MGDVETGDAGEFGELESELYGVHRGVELADSKRVVHGLLKKLSRFADGILIVLFKLLGFLVTHTLNTKNNFRLL